MMDYYIEVLSSFTPETYCGLLVFIGMFLGYFLARFCDLLLAVIGYLRDKREALKNK